MIHIKLKMKQYSIISRINEFILKSLKEDIIFLK